MATQDGPDSPVNLIITAASVSRALHAAGIVSIGRSVSGVRGRNGGVIVGGRGHGAHSRQEEIRIELRYDFQPSKARRVAVAVAEALTEAGYTVSFDVDIHIFDNDVADEMWSLTITRRTPDKTAPVPTDAQVYDLRADLAREHAYRVHAERQLQSLQEQTS
jgi:hypothetical protein